MKQEEKAELGLLWTISSEGTDRQDKDFVQ